MKCDVMITPCTVVVNSLGNSRHGGRTNYSLKMKIRLIVLEQRAQIKVTPMGF